MSEVLARPARVARFARLGSVNAVGLEAQADELARLALEDEARLRALSLAVSLFELVALEGSETPGAARELCAKAASAPVASLCVHVRLVPLCRERLGATTVRVASFATPEEAHRAAELGADEVTIVLDRAAFLTGRNGAVADEVARAKDAVGDALLKVIVPSRELGGYDNVRRASLLAMIGGADFVADSHGTPAAALCMLEAIRDVHEETGVAVGFGSAGVRAADRAVEQLVLVHETLGPDWLTPERCRIGGSGLLDDLLAEIRGASRRRRPVP